MHTLVSMQLKEGTWKCSNTHMRMGVDGINGLVIMQLEEVTSGLRAYAIAPGVVDTHMQEVIRACSPEQFPMVDKFLEMKERDTFNSPEFVARHLLGYAFDPDKRPDDTLVRVPAERES